jgi:NAD(P)-dependent dehydrogenase (short-subunit alcohol dehydrogenase family)
VEWSGLFTLEGKTAVLIGGAGVLTGAMANGLTRAGARVALADVDGESAERRAAGLRRVGAEAMALQADATRRVDLERVLHDVLERFGGVDILINAAGVNSGTPFFAITEAEWQHILDVDLKSVFLACQVFGRHMAEAGHGGSIINISSASSGPPLSKVFTYGIAKAGVNQITLFLARELAPYRVRVNALLPGFFPAGQNRRLLTEERTASILRHTPLGRFGEPCELAGATLFLACEGASSCVTGTILRVDGGFGAVTI